MSYLTQSEISQSHTMQDRIAQAATSEDLPTWFLGDGDMWAGVYRRTWAAAPGWDAAWESAKVSHPDDPVNGVYYDPGTDEAVITDAMILSQIQAMIADQEANPPDQP